MIQRYSPEQGGGKNNWTREEREEEEVKEGPVKRRGTPLDWDDEDCAAKGQQKAERMSDSRSPELHESEQDGPFGETEDSEEIGRESDSEVRFKGVAALLLWTWWVSGGAGYGKLPCSLVNFV